MCKWIFVLVGRSSVLWNPLILERGWSFYRCAMCCWCCVKFKDNVETFSCRLFSHFCFGLFEKWICCGLRNIYCVVHHDICVWSLFLPFDCSCCFSWITNIFRFFEILLSSLRVIPVHLGFHTPFCSLFVHFFYFTLSSTMFVFLTRQLRRSSACRFSSPSTYALPLSIEPFSHGIRASSR